MVKFDPDMLCPLCGKRKPLTNGRRWIAREHIPPKSLFVEGTSDLITVPSCGECNNRTSQHDLDFQHAIGIYTGKNSPERWQKTLRSLNKNPVRKKKKENILNNTSKVLTRTKAGWYGYKVKIEKKPVETVVKKIVKGLHWHVTGDVLPNDINVSITLLGQGENLNEELQGILNKYGNFLLTGNNSFCAHYAIAQDHNHASVWKLTFDGEDCFFVIIDPKRAKDKIGLICSKPNP